jgi:hypothetical protein
MSILPVLVASCFQALLVAPFLVPADLLGVPVFPDSDLRNSLLHVSVMVYFPVDNLILFPCPWHPSVLTINERDFIFCHIFVVLY